MSQPTVVNLKQHNKQPVRVPPIVHTVRQHARRSLSGLLQTLFNSTDDALFELADRSHSNTEQALYFESMRQIRLLRKEVCDRFGENLYANFDDLFQTGKKPETLADTEDLDNLSLVANDDLEITVAVAGIVSKVTAKHSLVLLQLTKRLDTICKMQSVTERANPLGPQKLSMAFVNAAESLDLDIKVMIILLKLFERIVMEHLEETYAQANELMVEAGVLPDLRSHARRGPAKAGASGAAASPTETHDANAQFESPMHGGAMGGQGPIMGSTPEPASFGVLQQLLTGARTSNPELGAGGPVGFGGGYAGGSGAGYAGGGYAGGDYAGGGGGFPGGGAVGGNAAGGVAGGGIAGAGAPGMAGGPGSAGISGDVSLPAGGVSISTPQLINLLTNLQEDADVDHIDPQAPAPLLDLRNMVFTRAEQVLDIEEKHIEQNDDDVINIVGMLFDYILNDRNLAIPMKALISRLQIPFVKLAILDKAFFEQTSHPARQLLNELTSAGIGWSSANELKRDARYNKIESIVLRVLNSFNDDISLFTDLVEDLREFVKREEKRHDQIEERVQQSEVGKAKTHATKEQVQQLINQKASGLRLPAQIGRFISDSYARALVMTGVKHGESSGEWHMNLQTLDDLLWCCQPLSTEADIQKRDEKLPALSTQLRNLIESIQDDETAVEELLFNVECDLSNAIARDKAYFESEATEPAELPDEYAQVAEVHLVEVTEETEAAPQAAPQFLEKLRGLKEGGWVELDVPGKSSVRCKLSTIVQPGDRYVFVNRRGMKVADFGRMDLAKLLEDNGLALLDESEVFDRALQAVVGNLRKMQSKPIPSTAANESEHQPEDDNDKT